MRIPAVSPVTEYRGVIVVSSRVTVGRIINHFASLIGDWSLINLASTGFDNQLTVRKYEGENTGSSRSEASQSVAGETVGSIHCVHIKEGDQLGPGERQILEIFLRILQVYCSIL